MINLALRAATWVQRKLVQADRRLQQLKLNLIVHQQIRTEEDVKRHMKEAGWMRPGASVDDAVCEECASGEEDGGHESWCSQYDPAEHESGC